MRVIYPDTQEPAYRIAADAFVEYWQKITGETLKAQPADEDGLPGGDLVLIGSDAVNGPVHELLKRGVIASLGIRYGSDDYCLLSVREGGRDILLLAGGSGRSTLYAVYDFFRRRGQVEYFWDADVFHHHGPIDVTNLHCVERPHFQYRGLRYFAHHGLHRFQAEHWTLDEWKREIDWCVKKRFNLFMLRIGADDLFQRAFDLPYPPEDAADPDALEGMNDRTSLWPLRLRGQLREEILAYARERGLIHPEDTGPMTHWYFPTPSSFFEKFPDVQLIGGQNTGWYDRKTQLVWDVASDEAMELYWRLTETHIREFGGGEPRMFHTIGLAERLYGETDEENLRLKLHALRRTQEYVRRRYPDTPLLIAGWDLMMFWPAREVRTLLEELDPTKTIIFDYNAEMASRTTYRECGLLGRFPWIFGLFHAYSFNNEMRGNYGRITQRLAEAAADPMCRGFLLWPELAHSDTFALEFLAEKSWRPERMGTDDLVADFCAKRYPAPQYKPWKGVWERALAITELVHWADGQWPITCFDQEFHYRLLESDQFTALPPARVAFYRRRCAEVNEQLADLPGLLDEMSRLLPEVHASEPMRRDVIDIARAGVNLALRTMFMDYCVRLEAWRTGLDDTALLDRAEDAIRRTFTLLADLLEQNEDFSVRLGLERLKQAHPVNPATESALKKNVSCTYNRNQTYEVVRHVYLREMGIYFDAMHAKIDAGDRAPLQWLRPRRERGRHGRRLPRAARRQRTGRGARSLHGPAARIDGVRPGGVAVVSGGDPERTAGFDRHVSGTPRRAVSVPASVPARRQGIAAAPLGTSSSAALRKPAARGSLLPRTMSLGSIRTRLPAELSGELIRSISARVANLPIASTGHSTVVSGGIVILDSARSSKPAMAMRPGTSICLSWQ